MRSPFK